MNIYFDNAASTMVREEAAEAMTRAMRVSYGNPSSMHEAGRKAAGELARARKSVADVLGADSSNIYFTSGGTEANNWAIFGVLGALGSRPRQSKHIITSAIEHVAVADPIKKLENEGWERDLPVPEPSEPSFTAV